MNIESILSMPTFLSDERSEGDTLADLKNYILSLNEQLRYVMANLGRDNINKTEYRAITDEISTTAINGLTLSASGDGSTSTIRLMSGGITVASTSISFSGGVSYWDLANAGYTEINGSNITTGTISAIDIDACTITGSTFATLLDVYGETSGELLFYYDTESPSTIAAGIRIDDNGAGTIYENQYRMIIYTDSVYGNDFALKLQSAGSMSMESGGEIYMSGDNIILDAITETTAHNFAIIDGDGGYWTFSSAGIMRDGFTVVAL